MMNNAKRLASVLKNETDATDIEYIAQILNYDEDQLKKDIDALYEAVYDRDC